MGLSVEVDMMAEHKCNHCGKEIKINFCIEDSVMKKIGGKAYCHDCIYTISKYRLENSEL